MTDEARIPLVSAADAQVLRGPWQAHQQHDGDWEVRAIINEQGQYILLAFDQNEPVARLIAAAPDMLAAMERFLRAFENIVPTLDLFPDELAEAMLQTRAAIAKARGGSQ